MKRILTLAAAILLLSLNNAVHAQRYCIIDSKYILEKVQEYKDGQAKLDALSKSWQTDIDNKMAEVDRMYKGYTAERAMLNEDMRKKREDEIVAKEKSVKDLQKQRFGYEGDLFKQRQIIIKPIQDKVYNAVQKYAASRSYDMVLDKAGGVTLFYADPKLDQSDAVLKQMGVTK